ncbi:MAG: ferric reductase-like transmembrane domain-containing protein [Anaerolineales bacterium]
MSTQNFNNTQINKLEKALLTIGLVGAVILLLAAGLYALETSTGFSLTNLFSLDSTHTWWYISRAAGLMGYLLFWLSTVWGFAISSKILDPILDRTFVYDFHEHLSLLSIGFVVLHVIVLLWETYQPLSPVEILVPFVSAYRPFWVGLGIIGFYLTLLVTITFYLRSYISMQVFRKIHYLSVVAYLFGLLHGLYSGTDSVVTWVQLLYWGTSLFTVFFCAQWLFTLYFQKKAIQGN